MTDPSCGYPASDLFTTATPSSLVSPPLPLPEELTTISTRTAATARKTAAAAICSSRCRRSESALIGEPRVGSRIADQPRRVEQEEDRHQHGTAHAPLADRLDLEQLQVCEEDAVAEAAQREEETAEAHRVVGEEGARQQQHVGDDPEDRDVDAGDVRVGAFRDGLAAGPARQADGRLASGLDDRDVGGDADAEGGEEGDQAAQEPLGGEIRRPSHVRTLGRLRKKPPR